VRLREIATTLGVTERSAFGIVTGLTAAGYVVNHREAAGRAAIEPMAMPPIRSAARV
jgi:DNA-binding IclR family transcriptional regulator